MKWLSSLLLEFITSIATMLVMCLTVVLVAFGAVLIVIVTTVVVFIGPFVATYQSLKKR